MDKLRPCPFCGKVILTVYPYTEQPHSGTLIICEDCYQVSLPYKKWQNRPVEDALIAALKKIIDMVERHPNGDVFLTPQSEKIAEARAAIALAEGAQ